MAAHSQQKMPTAAAFQKMIDAEWDEKIFYDTSYKQMKGKSPNDMTQHWHNDLFVRLSAPLKNMHAEYLAQVVQNCYQDRHMAVDFTNVPQINQCKEQTHERVMGQFFKDVYAVRDSSKIVYSQCLLETGNNVEKGLACVQQYLVNMQIDNDTLCQKFAKDYPQYL